MRGRVYVIEWRDDWCDEDTEEVTRKTRWVELVRDTPCGDGFHSRSDMFLMGMCVVLAAIPVVPLVGIGICGTIVTSVWYVFVMHANVFTFRSACK